MPFPKVALYKKILWHENNIIKTLSSKGVAEKITGLLDDDQVKVKKIFSSFIQYQPHISVISLKTSIMHKFGQMHKNPSFW